MTLGKWLHLSEFASVPPSTQWDKNCVYPGGSLWALNECQASSSGWTCVWQTLLRCSLLFLSLGLSVSFKEKCGSDGLRSVGGKFKHFWDVLTNGQAGNRSTSPFVWPVGTSALGRAFRWRLPGTHSVLRAHTRQQRCPAEPVTPSGKKGSVGV